MVDDLPCSDTSKSLESNDSRNDDDQVIQQGRIAREGPWVAGTLPPRSPQKCVFEDVINSRGRFRAPQNITYGSF